MYVLNVRFVRLCDPRLFCFEFFCWFRVNYSFLVFEDGSVFKASARKSVSAVRYLWPFIEEVKGAPWSFLLNKQKLWHLSVWLTRNALCVSLSCGKQAQLISFLIKHLQSHFLKVVSNSNINDSNSCAVWCRYGSRLCSLGAGIWIFSLKVLLVTTSWNKSATSDTTMEVELKGDQTDAQVSV